MDSIARGSPRVNPDPYAIYRALQSDPYAIYRDMGRHDPDMARLCEPTPADEPDADPIDAELDAWWAEVRDKSEWFDDLGRDDIAEFYGDEQFTDEAAFGDDERDAWEHQAIESYLRHREAEGAAEELARWGGSPA